MTADFVSIRYDAIIAAKRDFQLNYHFISALSADRSYGIRELCAYASYLANSLALVEP